MFKRMFVFICSVSMISCNYCSEFKVQSRRYFLDKNFTGIIDTVYLDSNDRNTPKMKVNKKRYDVLGYDIENLVKGDSVIKETGTLKLVLYKKGMQEPITLLPKCNGYEFE